MNGQHRADQQRNTWPPVDRWPPVDAQLHAEHWQHAHGALHEWSHEDQWLPSECSFAGLNDDDSY